MPYRPGSVDNDTRNAVIDAFRRAKAAGYDSADCYRAAVSAWLKIHPEHNRLQAARRVAEVVDEHFGPLSDS